MSEQAINAILNHYNINFEKAEVSPLGNGHINHTYKVKTAENSFVLQKINQAVFPEPEQLSQNIQLINQHLSRKKQVSQYAFSIPQQLLTKNGENAVVNKNEYWRLMEFIEGSYTIEAVSSVNQAHAVAKAFSTFSCALSDLPSHKLNIILPEFHDLSARLKQLKTAVHEDKQARLSHCNDLIDYCFSQQSFINKVAKVSASVPTRITHNDTKINNLLFQGNDKIGAVIDLDTCMPGLLMHDFGDMVRTCCSNLAEDDANIKDMTFNIEIFSTLLSSYQAGFEGKMTEQEKASLLVGAKLLPFMVGVRFLTDYLNGDTYFKTNRQAHNLERARNQVQLYKLIAQDEPSLSKLL